MNAIQFKRKYYLECSYDQISELEFSCKIVVYKKENKNKVDGIETRINFFELDEKIKESEFYSNQISWENVLNQTITMLFHALMLKIQLSDIHTIDGKDSIADFFVSNPFHEE